VRIDKSSIGAVIFLSTWPWKKWCKPTADLHQSAMPLVALLKTAN